MPTQLSTGPQLSPLPCYCCYLGQAQLLLRQLQCCRLHGEQQEGLLGVLQHPHCTSDGVPQPLPVPHQAAVEHSGKSVRW